MQVDIFPSNGNSKEPMMTLHEKSAIEAAILQQKCGHSLQSLETPFTCDKFIKNAINPTGNDPQFDALLDGSTVKNSEQAHQFSPTTQLWIDSLQKLVEEEIPLNITVVDFKNYLHSKQKHTASSPSGQHMGQYRMMLECIRHEEYTIPRTIISIAHIFLISHCPLSQWQRAYALPGQTCNTAVLNKLLFLDLSRQTLTPGVLFDYDAKAAFDRVLARLSEVMCQRVGLPRISGLFMFYLLQHMSFHLITGFGCSAQEFNNNEDNIMGQGVLQGSSSAAPIYIINLDVSLATYQKLGKGSTFYHPITKEPIEDKTVQYVDDTSQFIKKPTQDSNIPLTANETETNLHQYASHNANLWSECLWLSGGQLNSNKCYFYAFCPYINYKTNKIMYTDIPMPSEVTIMNRASGKPLTIPNVPSGQARRTLGVILSSKGAHTAQLKHTQQ
jgi:hypothetical protein